MIWGLIYLNLCFFLFVLTIVYTQEIKKSLRLFFVILVTIFYTPMLYFSVFEGLSYKYFSENAYEDYLVVSGTVFLFVTLFTILKYRSNLCVKVDTREKPLCQLGHVYMAFATICVFLYVWFFADGFPLIQLITQGQLIDRPDTTGSVPHYYSVSTYLCFVVPGFYFYLKDKIKSDFLRLSLLLLAILLTILDGGKGVVVFFFIFIWLFQEHAQINLKLLLMGSVSLVIYLLLKGRWVLNAETFEYLLTSPLRRFFVTQGACFINRIEMIYSGFLFDMSSVKSDVYRFMYGEWGGTAPTYFLGDLIVRYGYFSAFLLHGIVLCFVFVFSVLVDAVEEERLFVQWNFSIILLLIGYAQIDLPSIARVVAIFATVVIVLFPKVKSVKLVKRISQETG